MAPRARLRIVRGLCAALWLLALIPGRALAQSEYDPPIRLARPHDPATSRAAIARTRLGTAAAPGDTIWIGYSTDPAVTNHWKVGPGPARPGVNDEGLWTWDTPVHGDSLQGWWPVREPNTLATSVVPTDVDRPWWAIENGNRTSYVINQGRFDAAKLGTAWPGNRTVGVVGVWHSDPGNAAGFGVGWSPLGGTRSAWMGLRQHGDLTVSDPVTGNPFSADANQLGPLTAGSLATSLALPGYLNQMDQMLYRDIDVSGVAGPVTLSFQFATRMSTGKTTSLTSRTGWFEGDPLTTASPNFVSAEAGSPANTLAPIDSFQVYVGKPVEGTWVASDGATRAVYDPLRRWFNEVLDRNARFWLFGRAGDNAAQGASVVISAAELAAIQSGGNTLMRVVFRVHTNQSFSDESGPSSYTSAGRGAAQVDDVAIDFGSGPVTIGDFEGTSPSKDIDNLQPATAAWRSTGKPPAVLFHVHDLASLPWNDVCGGLTSANRACDMRGNVISMGDHDRNEDVVGPQGSADLAGVWGMVSPTINLKADPGVKNGWGLTYEDVYGAEMDLAQDLYTGALQVFTDGDLWTYGAQFYPEYQPAGGPAAGTPQWGPLRRPASNFTAYTTGCTRFVENLTSTVLGYSPIGTYYMPDSVRVVLRRINQCYRFGIPEACNPATAGAYLDNVSFGLVHGPAPVALDVNPWDWLQDTFPFNGSPTLPGTAAFDTTTALVRSGLNIAQQTVTLQRFDVPGDTLVAYGPGAGVRVDLVFRVRPGPGNYVTAGVIASGLRRVPASATAVSAGDGSWWDQWRTAPGDFASPGAVALHAAAPGGWDPDVWMSARLDTAQTGLFPIESRGVGDGTLMLAAGLWMSAYHESDPHFTSLGIPRHKCFLIDTLSYVNSTNITCSAVPAWVTAAKGYDGSPNTLEGTPILPDGLFTPGTHIEYFLRRSDAGGVALMPDTGLVVPQPEEGSLDGHRWADLSVLPDRWKAPEYGGAGMAPHLVVDWHDGSGDERAWVAIADTACALRSDASWRGAHNGWSAPGGGADPNDPAHFVSAHRGQPGPLWDLYNVRGALSPLQVAGTIGSRLAYQDPSPGNLVNGKTSTQGPSLEMLRAYYRDIVLLTGTLSATTSYGLLGPFTDRSADDEGLITQFLQAGTLGQPNALLAWGDDVVNSQSPDVFTSDLLGVQAVSGSYLQYASDPAVYADLPLLSPLDPAGAVLGARNSCDGYQLNTGPDVIAPSATLAAEAVPVSLYGSAVPANVASVWKPATAAHPWAALTNGYALGGLLSRFGATSAGRLALFDRVFANLVPASYGLFPDTCAVPTLDAPPPAALADYARIANNPVRSGVATVSLGLAAADHVVVRLYDVSGRAVRTLADRTLPAGEHRLAWNGADDAGRAVPRGVYFARVRYATRGFESARKLVLLR